MRSVVGTCGGVVRGVSFTITWVSSLGALTAPGAQFSFLCFKNGAILVKSCELRVEQGKNVFERCRTPVEAVVGTAAVTAAAAVMSASLAAGFRSKEGRPQR